MSVDWYPCKHCGDTYADCGHYGNCSRCERDFCGNCYDGFVKKYGVIDEDHDEYCNYGESLPECDHCNGIEVDDDELLGFALKKLNISIKELKDEYIKANYKSL